MSAQAVDRRTLKARTYPTFVHRMLRQVLDSTSGVRGMWRLRRHLLNVETVQFPRGALVSRLIFGQKIWLMPNDLIGRHLFYQRVWEGSTARHFYEGLKLGDTVVDVGANIGQYTLLAGSKVGPNGKVFAVEPGAVPRDLLERSLELNELRNVTVLSVAAWDSDTTLHLNSSEPSNIGAAEVNLEAPIGGMDVTPIPARKLEPVLRGLGCERIDVLKIDIEGAELPALRGLQGYFHERPPRRVYCELCGEHDRFGDPINDLLGFFDRFGYRASVFADDGLKPLNRSDLNRSTKINVLLEAGLN
jgi:FkbM family methyltransferase